MFRRIDVAIIRDSLQQSLEFCFQGQPSPLQTVVIILLLLLVRSQWPRVLTRGSAAARFLGLRVRIPPRAWMFVVSVVYCQVEVSATGWWLLQRSPTDCGVSDWDHDASIMRGHWPTGGLLPHGKYYYYYYYYYCYLYAENLQLYIWNKTCFYGTCTVL